MFRAFAVAFVSVLAIFAYGAEVIEGSLSCMKGEKYITIKLDCSKLVYKKDRPFQVFLDKAARIDDWEQESLKYFCLKFNEETYKAHLSAVVNSETKEKIATIGFKAEGDDNDAITLRDPMKEAGESIGKIIYKSIKK